MSMINVTIDGQATQVPAGSAILDAAVQLGVEIPTLCYLEMEKKFNKQSAACRVCVVEVEGRRNLAPACATPVMEGMVIKTDTERVHEARKIVVDLMLSDHPQDCLTCQQAGKCTLQDLCYQYGLDQTSYAGQRNDFPKDATNKFYTRDMNKCVACRRCSNVCESFQHTEAIGFSDRGFPTHPSVAFDDNIEDSNCVSCGNCVSVCPTGALVASGKEKFRNWEISKTDTTCSYCGVGCQMSLLTKGNKVVGVEPLNGAANDGLLCVKGKFGYNFINHPDRLKTPLIKKNGEFVEAGWEEAYALIVDKVKAAKSAHGNEALAGLTSARVTTEENYLFQKMVRAGFGNNSVDHCARL